MATVSRSNAPGTRQGEREAALIDLRHTLDWMGDEVHVIGAPVDPIVEMAAISKAFDNSKALVAENVRGYPDARLISNLWATKERCARLFGVDEFRDIKFKLLDSLRAPIAPREVARDEAPCQEIVLERDAIARIEDVLPLCTHTEDDGGRFFGNGVHFIGPPWVPGGGTQFSFYRMAFREGQEYASVNMVPGGQGDAVCRRWPGEKIPVTVNICPPPAIEMLGYSTFNSIVFPGFTDEIGMAGALQGSPVEIVKAKTVDAYAIAQSEWVLEIQAQNDNVFWGPSMWRRNAMDDWTMYEATGSISQDGSGKIGIVESSAEPAIGVNALIDARYADGRIYADFRSLRRGTTYSTVLERQVN